MKSELEGNKEKEDERNHQQKSRDANDSININKKQIGMKGVQMRENEGKD